MALEHLIHDCFVSVADTVGDPSDLVYRRFVTEFPDYQHLFSLDVDGSVRGAMLQQSLECLIGLANGEDAVARTLLVCERENHFSYGVRSEDFAGFFNVIRDSFKNVLGPRWQPEWDDAWKDLNHRVDAVLGVEVSSD